MTIDTLRPTTEGKWLHKIGREPFYGDVALGNYTQYRVAAFKIGGGLFLAIEMRGAFRFNGLVHYGYVMEKLNLQEGDARHVADFINAQFEGSYKTQGTYYPRACAAEHPDPRAEDAD